jgi:hypothetical protein
MSPTIYHIIHLVSLFVLFGITFYAFAAPAETRKKALMISGIASVLVLVSGFGLVSKLYGNKFELWMIIKLGCWFLLSAFTGFGYRRRGVIGGLMAVSIGLVALAVAMVYLKPTL